MVTEGQNPKFLGICLSAFILNTEIFLHVNKTAFSGHFRVFPTDDSPLKMLYLAMMDITKKQKGHRQDWCQIHSQLEIYFDERLTARNPRSWISLLSSADGCFYRICGVDKAPYCYTGYLK